MSLPKDPKERKKYPLFTGLMKYFPDALAAVAHLSWVGNEQHNPGEPLHWAREKSTDQEDTLMRHLIESGTLDTDGERHSTKVAWRALAKLQLEIEADREKTNPNNDHRAGVLVQFNEPSHGEWINVQSPPDDSSLKCVSPRYQTNDMSRQYDISLCESHGDRSWARKAIGQADGCVGSDSD